MTTEKTEKTENTASAAAPAEAAPDPPEDSADSFLISVFVMLVVFAIAEVFYRSSPVEARMRKGATYITAKTVDYEAAGGDIVWTGDSRMYHALNPAVMTEKLQALKGKTYTGFDYAVPAGSMPMFLLIANEAVHHKPPPRIFIIGVTPPVFSCPNAVVSIWVSPAVRWSTVAPLVRVGWYTTPDDAAGAVFYGASRLLGMRTNLLPAIHDLAVPVPITFQNRGYFSMGPRVDPATQAVRARGRAIAYAELMDKSKGAVLRPNPGRYLRETIALLKRRGITVIVMGTPQARQLDWYHDAAHTYFEYVDEVKRITAEQGVPFIDMNAPPGIASTDFMDGDHLSEPGATIFTNYVTSEILAPLLP